MNNDVVFILKMRYHLFYGDGPHIYSSLLLDSLTKIRSGLLDEHEMVIFITEMAAPWPTHACVKLNV